jgi:hypothetical protein
MIDKIRILMIETQLPIYLWMESVKIVIYFKNRSPIKSLLNTTLWESFNEEKSNLFKIRIIELPVYCYNIETETDLNRRIKSDFRIRQIRLIGYDKRSN